MKIYVLLSGDAYSASVIIGVYSTEMLARKARKDAKKSGTLLSDMWLEEHDLDPSQIFEQAVLVT